MCHKILNFISVIAQQNVDTFYGPLCISLSPVVLPQQKSVFKGHRRTSVTARGIKCLLYSQ